MKLSELTKEIPPWIKDLETRTLYNEPFKSSDGKYHYCYAEFDSVTQWIYVGAHKSTVPVDTNYRGSSENPHFHYAWNLRKDSFIQVILGYVKDEYSYEKILIPEDYIERFSHNGIYNLKLVGMDHGHMSIRKK